MGIYRGIWCLKMKKLKTLKDIEINTSSSDPVEQTLIIATQAEYYTKLKEAAKEWIKYVDTFERGDRTYSDLKGIDRDIDLHYYHSELLIEWIKHFFDLENSNG